MLPNQFPTALEALGWASFQDLALAYAEDTLGVRLIAYAKSRDLGMDGAQGLVLVEDPSERRLVVQAKHTSTTGTLSHSRFAPEISKMPQLVENGFSDYLLVTNHSVSGQTAQAIEAEARAAGFTHFEVHGREQIERQIRASSTLRAMVPRLYGIGDLSQILDGRLIDQTKVLLATAKTDLERFVATDAYRDSIRALHSCGAIVLLGEPAAGKSTIARALSVAALDTFDASPLFVPSLEKLQESWNPNDPARLYWIDDIFGSTQLTADTVEDFNRLVPVINAALAQGAKFVFTSRTYIWRSAIQLLKLSAIPRLKQGLIEIRVEDYSVRDRAQIVYNHVKHGDQSPEWKKRFKRWAPRVAEHPQFSPEVARRFGLAIFAGSLTAELTAVDAFVRNPADYLEEVIGGLPAGGQAALALILMAGGELASPRNGLPLLDQVCAAFGVSTGDVIRELAAMEGAFCVRTIIDGEPGWRFRHPTIGEAVASVASGSEALLDVYLKGADLRRVLQEVVCAGIEVKGAVIPVGPSRYEILLNRLREVEPYFDTRLVRWFLLHKATPEFRRRYFGEPVGIEHPLFDMNYTGRTLSIGLLAVLNDEGLLTEDGLAKARARIRRAIRDYGMSDYVDEPCRNLLGAEAFDELILDTVETLRDGGEGYFQFWTPTGDDRREVEPDKAFSELINFVERLEWYVDYETVEELLEIIRTEAEKRGEALQAELDEEDWEREREAEHYYQTAREAGWYRPAATSSSATSRAFVSPRSMIDDIFSDMDD